MADCEFICNLMCFICRLDLHNFPFHRSSIFFSFSSSSSTLIFFSLPLHFSPFQKISKSQFFRLTERRFFLPLHSSIIIPSMWRHSRVSHWMSELLYFSLSVGKAKASFTPTHVQCKWHDKRHGWNTLRTTFGPRCAENIYKKKSSVDDETASTQLRVDCRKERKNASLLFGSSNFACDKRARIHNVESSRAEPNCVPCATTKTRKEKWISFMMQIWCLIGWENQGGRVELD